MSQPDIKTSDFSRVRLEAFASCALHNVTDPNGSENLRAYVGGGRAATPAEIREYLGDAAADALEAVAKAREAYLAIIDERLAHIPD